MIVKPSEEQQEILNTLAGGYNVIGDCVAGSGKTTSVLLIASTFPDKKVIQITYNSQLKSEVRQKAIDAGLKNLEVHTYHSLVVRYYDSHGHDDAVIRKIVSSNASPHHRLPAVDILIIDEAQDMTHLYYSLMRKFQRDITTAPQIVVLGDKFQGIYKFKDADPRYLTLGHALWDSQHVEEQEPQNFIPVTLTTSYRVTNQIAEFVNTCMLQTKRIRAIRNGPKVQYYRANVFGIHKPICEMIRSSIESGSIRPEEIFILAGSIRSDTSPVRKLENALVEAHIPCYFPTSDDSRLDEDIVQGKVVFSTFHQAKGRERKMVIIYGFDNSYFKYFGKDYKPTECPETLYVATTRAKETLILLENMEEGPLPFLQNIRISPFMEIRGKDSQCSYKTLTEFGFGHPSASLSVAAPKYDSMHRTSVTELTRFINEQNLNVLINIINEIYTEEIEPQYQIPIPSKIAFGDYTEEVSDINGIVIPAMYEAKICGKSTIEIDVMNKLQDIMNNNSYKFIREACKRLPDSVKSVEDYCFMVVIYIAMTENIYHKLEQVKHYKWMTQTMVNACFEALEKHLTEDTIFEEKIVLKCDDFSEYGCVEIAGRMDAINDDCVWEFKCTDSLSIEHLLQLAVYAYMWKGVFEEEHGPREFRLMNIRTGQIYRLNSRSHLLREMMQVLFHNKFAKQQLLTDQEFVDRCKKGVEPHKGTRKKTECFID
jgi:hypothetical protein